MLVVTPPIRADPATPPQGGRGEAVDIGRTAWVNAGRRTAVAGLLALLACGRAAFAQPSESGRPGPRPSASRLAEPERVRRRLGLAPEYSGVRGIESLKIAVLDYGFEGMAGDRPYLPASAEVVEHYDPDFVRRFGLGDPDYRKPFEPGNRHGRAMAQIVWAVTGSRPVGPKFYLLNANGPTMLRRAVHLAIEREVDIVLFSGSFEGGGDGDGRGPINRVVDEALARDILWINAAGNHGRRVYDGPVRILADGYLRLRGGSDVASLRFRNRADENDVTVTLTWSDYREAEDAGTTKDLDLEVEDWTGRVIGVGDKVQVAGDRPPGPNESRNPRERVVLSGLPANPVVPSDPDYGYRIRVRARRGAFSARDRLRVLVTASREMYVPPGGPPAEALEFVDATGEGELYPPADNPRVLTVGDTGPASSVGPTADRRVKPDLVLDDSRAFFTDGEVSAGSSNAAAYFAGIVAVLKAAEPNLRLRHLMRLAREGEAVSRDEPIDPRTRPISGPSPRPPPPAASRPDLRLWRTPTRARLAQVIREDR